MKIDDRHLLEDRLYLPSPNCDARPLDLDIALVVIHCISLRRGEYGSGLPRQLFMNEIDFEKYPELTELQRVRVSAHVLIERDGTLTQFVPFDQRAWHAGVSSWHGRANCNDFSIGIELEGTEDTVYEDSQYDVLTLILSTLMTRYRSLSLANIVGHSEIAPDRKIDPGPTFDWRRLYRQLTASMNESHLVAHEKMI